MNPQAPKTMFEKIWDQHVVHQEPEKQTIIYIDLHLVHEVTSPQAFEGLRLAGRTLRRPELTVATQDHNVPTTDRSLPIVDPVSKQQIETLRTNCKEFGVRLYDLDNVNQGIVHVIGPELGLTQPGMTIVCGDSHTATHGAFGALAFGIGTSEVEHVMATQTLLQSKPKTFEIRIDGKLARGVTSKDLILYLIGKISTSGGTGYVIEYTGEAIRSLSMEERMTICNMSIEAGARAGMIAPDETTFEYFAARSLPPKHLIKPSQTGKNCQAMRALSMIASRFSMPPTLPLKSLGEQIRDKSYALTQRFHHRKTLLTRENKNQFKLPWITCNSLPALQFPRFLWIGFSSDPAPILESKIYEPLRRSSEIKK